MFIIDELKVKRVRDQFHSVVFKVVSKDEVKLAYVASELNNKRTHDTILPNSNIEFSYFDPKTGYPKDFECRYYNPKKKSV